MVDRELLREGDERHFRELVETHNGLVITMARTFTDDEDAIDDLVQGTWIKVWRRRHTYRGGPFATWLLVIARNHCRDMWRRDGSRKRGLDTLRRSLTSEASPDPLQQVEEAERRETMASLIDRLPERQREALLYRASGLFSTEEIAHLMGVAPASVRSHYSKGLARLAELREKTS